MGTYHKSGAQFPCCPRRHRHRHRHRRRHSCSPHRRRRRRRLHRQSRQAVRVMSVKFVARFVVAAVAIAFFGQVLITVEHASLLVKLVTKRFPKTFSSQL